MPRSLKAPRQVPSYVDSGRSPLSMCCWAGYTGAGHFWPLAHRAAYTRGGNGYIESFGFLRKLATNYFVVRLHAIRGSIRFEVKQYLGWGEQNNPRVTSLALGAKMWTRSGDEPGNFALGGHLDAEPES